MHICSYNGWIKRKLAKTTGETWWARKLSQSCLMTRSVVFGAIKCNVDVPFSFALELLRSNVIREILVISFKITWASLKWLDCKDFSLDVCAVTRSWRTSDSVSQGFLPNFCNPITEVGKHFCRCRNRKRGKNVCWVDLIFTSYEILFSSLVRSIVFINGCSMGLAYEKYILVLSHITRWSTCV